MATMNDITAALSKLRDKHLEFLVAAFIQEIGCKPSDCELVQITEGMTIRWYFRKRDKANDKKT